MCGIFGIFNARNAAEQTYFGLHALQHRGQEAAGIASSAFDESRQQRVMLLHRGKGKVDEVFTEHIFQDKLLGDAAIGHTRYSTSGSADNGSNFQPFMVRYQEGHLALAHNGNLTNFHELRSHLVQEGTLFQSTADSEIILHLIAKSRRSDPIKQIMDALGQVEGAFSLLLLTDDQLIAVRDPHGFRPLALGRLPNPNAKDGFAYCVASETCAFDINGAEYIRDIEPGEILVIDRDGCRSDNLKRHFLTPAKRSHCIFEYVYFSRPDSMVFGEMTDKVRRKIGKQLAHEAPPPKDPTGARTLVISVPDSSNTATLGYAYECQKNGHHCRYEIGLIRNHYVGRTFISPGQQSRERKVRCKFNTVSGVLKNRVVTVVDDSIVRGTTLKQLVQMIRDAGAREVHLRITSPQVMNPCYYGMDFPSYTELLAYKHNGDVDSMAAFLNADSLAFLSSEGLQRAVRKANRKVLGKNYCTACFTADYPVLVEEGMRKEEHEG